VSSAWRAYRASAGTGTDDKPGPDAVRAAYRLLCPATPATPSTSATPSTTSSSDDDHDGETSVLTGIDGDNAGFIVEQDAVLGQAGTLKTLSFYVLNPVGQLRLGVYDAAGGIIVQTAAFTPVAGWNTQPVGNVSIAAGSYMLAYEQSNNNLSFPVNQSSGRCRLAARAFGAMPTTFPTAIVTDNPCHWSFYATLSVP